MSVGDVMKKMAASVGYLALVNDKYKAHWGEFWLFTLFLSERIFIDLVFYVVKECDSIIPHYQL